MVELLTSNVLGPASENNLFGMNFQPNPGESLLVGLKRVADNVGDKFKEQPIIEAKIRQSIGEAYSSPTVKQPSLAIPQYERAIALRKAFAGPDDASRLQCMKMLAFALRDSGRLAEALALNAETLKLSKAKYGPGSQENTVFMYMLADTYQRDGQNTEAIALFEEMIGISKATASNEIWTITCIRQLAPLYEKLGKIEQAEASWRESVSIREQQDAGNSVGVATSLAELGVFLLRQNRGSEAESLLRRSLRIREEAQPDSWSTGGTRSLLGEALRKQNRLPEAEPFLLAGYADIKKHEEEIPIDRKDRLGNAIERLVVLYEEWGKPTQAAEWRQRLQEFNQAQPKNDPRGRAVK